MLRALLLLVLLRGRWFERATCGIMGRSIGVGTIAKGLFVVGLLYGEAFRPPSAHTLCTPR